MFIPIREIEYVVEYSEIVLPLILDVVYRINGLDAPERLDTGLLGFEINDGAGGLPVVGVENIGNIAR